MIAEVANGRSSGVLEMVRNGPGMGPVIQAGNGFPICGNGPPADGVVRHASDAAITPLNLRREDHYE